MYHANENLQFKRRKTPLAPNILSVSKKSIQSRNHLKNGKEEQEK